MITERTLDLVGRIIVEKLGLDFPANKRNDLKRGILAAANDLGFQQQSTEFIQWLEAGNFNAQQLEIIATHLTVGETYFFREDSALKIFREIILPGLIEKRKDFTRSLRIWSAGCCSGEEAYTIAIILRETIPDIENWSITILGTDLNTRFLKKASQAKYTAWSFRDTPEGFKKQYFTLEGKEFELKKEIRKMVIFNHLNLVENVYPDVKTNTTDMDVIFCRNVLMYFTPAQIRDCGRRFFKSLMNDGWFITSAVELSDDLFPQFHKVNAFQTVVYQKNGSVAGGVNEAFSLKSAVPDVVFQPSLESEIPPQPMVFDFGAVGESEKELPGPTQPDPISLRETKNTLDQLAAIAEREYQGGNYQQVISTILGMGEQDRFRTDTMHLLIHAYANTGKLTEARHSCEDMLERDKLNAENYHLFAMVLIELGEVELATANLKKALYLSHDHLMATYMLANIELRSGRQPQAKKLFQHLVKMLGNYHDEDPIPGSDGMTAGRMRQLINTYI
jgi:chemotaxis protein methyltransferase CheR